MIIPTELLTPRTWVCWRYRFLHGRESKVPYTPTSGRHARVNDPSTFVYYRTASRHLWCYDGLSFAITREDPYCGIDIDNCIADGQIFPFAKSVIQRLNSFTEISPSGAGIRIIVKARLPIGPRRNHQIELYDQLRFLSITGNHLKGLPTTIEHRQQEVDALYRDLFPKQQAPQPVSACQPMLAKSDDELISLAMEKSQRFERAWNGELADWAGDHSAADLYLCARLAHWTGNNVSRVDRLFRSSGLMRTKWDAPRAGSTYGQMTISASLDPPEYSQVFFGELSL